MASERKVTVITPQDFEGVSHEQVSDFVVRGELARLAGLRQEFGDEIWAENLTAAVISQLTLLGLQFHSEQAGIAKIAERLITALTPQLIELYSRPDLGHHAVIGMMEELAARSFLPGVDIDQLYEKQRNWKK